MYYTYIICTHKIILYIINYIICTYKIFNCLFVFFYLWASPELQVSTTRPNMMMSLRIKVIGMILFENCFVPFCKIN